MLLIYKQFGALPVMFYLPCFLIKIYHLETAIKSKLSTYLGHIFRKKMKLYYQKEIFLEAEVAINCS